MRFNWNKSGGARGNHPKMNRLYSNVARDHSRCASVARSSSKEMTDASHLSLPKVLKPSGNHSFCTGAKRSWEGVLFVNSFAGFACLLVEASSKQANEQTSKQLLFAKNSFCYPGHLNVHSKPFPAIIL